MHSSSLSPETIHLDDAGPSLPRPSVVLSSLPSPPLSPSPSPGARASALLAAKRLGSSRGAGSSVRLPSARFSSLTRGTSRRSSFDAADRSASSPSHARSLIDSELLEQLEQGKSSRLRRKRNNKSLVHSELRVDQRRQSSYYSESDDDAEEDDLEDMVAKESDKMRAASVENRAYILEDAVRFLLGKGYDMDTRSVLMAKTIRDVLEENRRSMALDEVDDQAESDFEKEVQMVVKKAMDAAKKPKKKSILSNEGRAREAFVGYCYNDVPRPTLSEITFMEACVEGDVDVVVEVLEFCDRHDVRRLVRWENHLGQTVLHRLAAIPPVAQSPDHVEIAVRILELGADVSLCDNLGWSPIHHAIQNKFLEMIGCLCEFGASILNASDAKEAFDMDETPEQHAFKGNLDPDLVSSEMTDALKSCSGLEWCISTANGEVLDYLLAFTRITITSPSSSSDGGCRPVYYPKPLSPEKVEFSWSCMSLKKSFRICMHTVGTVSNLAGEEHGKTVDKICTSLTHQIHRNFSTERPTSEVGLENFVFSATFKKYHTLNIATVNDAESYTWVPPLSLYNKVPEDSLVIFEVLHVSNSDIRGFSEVMALFPE